MHITGDGNVIFTIGTGEAELGNSFGAIGSVAVDVMARAVIHAMLNATSVEGCLSHRDIFVGACVQQAF